MLSSAGYGLFWNNTSRSRFNNRFEHALYISSEVADSIDYYFLYGPEFDRIIAALQADEFNLTPWITHRATLETAADAFPYWSGANSIMIKGLISI